MHLQKKHALCCTIVSGDLRLSSKRVTIVANPNAAGDVIGHWRADPTR